MEINNSLSSLAQYRKISLDKEKNQNKKENFNTQNMASELNFSQEAKEKFNSIHQDDSQLPAQALSKKTKTEESSSEDKLEKLIQKLQKIQEKIIELTEKMSKANEEEIKSLQNQLATLNAQAASIQAQIHEFLKYN